MKKTIHAWIVAALVLCCGVFCAMVPTARAVEDASIRAQSLKVYDGLAVIDALWIESVKGQPTIKADLVTTAGDPLDEVIIETIYTGTGGVLGTDRHTAQSILNSLDAGTAVMQANSAYVKQHFYNVLMAYKSSGGTYTLYTCQVWGDQYGMFNTAVGKIVKGSTYVKNWDNYSILFQMDDNTIILAQDFDTQVPYATYTSYKGYNSLHSLTGKIQYHIDPSTGKADMAYVFDASITGVPTVIFYSGSDVISGKRDSNGRYPLEFEAYALNESSGALTKNTYTYKASNPHALSNMPMGFYNTFVNDMNGTDIAFATSNEDIGADALINSPYIAQGAVAAGKSTATGDYIEAGSVRIDDSIKDITTYRRSNRTLWGGKFEKLNNGDILYVYKNLNSHKVTIVSVERELDEQPAGQYVIQVIDGNNTPISGADVTWNAESSQTGWDGKVFFNAFTMGDPVIRVSKAGYIPWTNENSNWKKSTSQFEKVILYPESYGSLKLSSARLKYTKIGTCDLLTKTKILNLRNESGMIWEFGNGEFDITCLAATAGEASSYALYQGTKKIAESSNGEFLALNVRDFTAGGGCFVRVTGKNGKTVDTRINLEFAKNSVNKDYQFGIKGNKISFRISDGVPYVGGSTVTFELPMEAPVIATATPDKIQLGINMNLNPDKSEEQISSYINMIRKAAIAGNQKLTKANMEQFKKMAAKHNEAEFFKDCDFTFCGYAEGDFGSKKASGYLMIIMDLKIASIKYNTVVYFVPVTVQVSADLTMEAGGSVQYSFDTNTWNGNIFLNPEFKLKPFFGVGYSDLAGVGVYGRAELSAKWNVFGTQSGLRSVDLTGELGIKAYLGPWEGSKAFAHQTWHLYTASTVGTKTLHSAQPAWNEAFAADFTTSDLSYLADESEWDPDFAEPYTAARSSLVQTYASEAKTSYETLLSSTYRNAQPVMISDGNALYAAFVRADADSNARYIAVTKFDGNKWCEPVRVDTNSILDDAPQLCVDESGQVWLAYAQTVEEPGESIVAYAQNQAITVGTIDTNTLAFTKQETYHSGSYMHLQTLSCVDGTPVLAWVDSTVTDENSVAAPNSGIIYMAQYADGTWTEAREVEAVSQNVDSLCIGVQNGAAIVAYTSGAKLIFNGQVAAEDVIGKAVFGRLPGSEDDSFIWSAEGCLQSSGGDTVFAENMGREFAIIGNSVYYNMSDDGCANLAVIQYDAENGRWGASSCLIGDDKYLENLNAATLNGQTYVLGMHTTATLEAAGIEDSKDLVWTRIFPVNDLKLESVDFDANTLVPGETLPVTVTVYNAGDHTATDLTILADGVSIASQNCNILSGESEEITVDITCPFDKRTITFNVQETGAEDYTLEDNETDCTIGFADAELELSFLQIGSQKSLLASVVNRGLESASGSILFSDSTGEILAERTFRNLEYNGTVIAEFVPETFIGLFDSDVTAVVTLDQTELNTLNNTDSVPILISTTGILAMRQSTDAVKVEVSCMQDKVVKAYCAFYDQYNRMLGVDIQTVDSGKVSEISFAKRHGAASAKIFILDDAAVPVCPAETLILQ